MHKTVLVVIGLTGLALLPRAADAFPAAAARTELGSAAYYHEAAQGCGPGFHWVGRHRNRYGAWVPGRCVRN